MPQDSHTAAPSTTAEAREIALWDQAKGHDMDAFAGSLDPEFVAVYAGAVNDPAEEVAAIKQQQLDSFALSDLSVRELAENVELVTYDAEATGTFAGEDISGRYRATSIWKLTDGSWRLAYHSEMKAE